MVYPADTVAYKVAEMRYEYEADGCRKLIPLRTSPFVKQSPAESPPKNAFPAPMKTDRSPT